MLISCCELTVFCITDLSLIELFSNVLKAGFLMMRLLKVCVCVCVCVCGGGGGGGGGLYCVPIMYLKTAI